MSRSVCTIEGCERYVVGRGWCGKHYDRWRYNGDPLVTRTPTLGLPLRDRLLEWFTPGDPSECWPWQGSVSKRTGYGQTRGEAGTTGAHRVVYEAFVGPIPAGMTLDHECHTSACAGGVSCAHRRCVNPNHLAPATIKTNVLRSPATPAAKNAAKTHCPKNHPYTGDNVRISILRSGRTARVCRTCKRESNRARRVTM